MRTDRTLPNIKPAIIICENKKRTLMLIEVALSGDRNLIRQGAERILKYKDFITEFQCM